MCTMYANHPIKMEGLQVRNDLLLTAYGQPDHTNTTGEPRAKKVSFDGTGKDAPFLPTPPDSPVFAELTTAGQDIKPNMAKLISFQEQAPQAVPNLEMNPSFSDCYMNTVYSPYQPTSPFYEGTFSDDPFGASNNVLVKQEPESFPDVFTTPSLDLPQQFQGLPSQTVFEAPAHPQIKEEYSESIPSPTPSCAFDSIGHMAGSFPTDTLPDFTSFTGLGRDQLNSGGEDAEYDSGSEASFTLTSNDSEDSLDDISPFDPNNDLGYSNGSSMQQRTHNYKRHTFNQSVAALKGGIPKVALQQNPIKKRGRPRKLHGFPNGEGNGLLGHPGRRGRGRRDAMKGNHLWEFIRDLLKDPSFSPKYIRWEEKDEGVFRFVNSEAVARMWGHKKNNPAMTYEKLSRAMRYYYKRDILERVDGRRLVYKFGKNAVGWKQAAGLTNESVDK